MKSINISSFLLLSLFPFVAFCRSFTSDNPIVLPTTTHDNLVTSTPVLDMDGNPLKVNKEYRIYGDLPGGGCTYLADLGNTRCPNGVVQDSSGEFNHCTSVMFFTMQLGSHYVFENQDVRIMFSNSTKPSCVNETVWQVHDYILGPPPRFVITGDTLTTWFKIEKFEMGIHKAYKLRYCPSKDICPTCDFDCADVGLTENNGYGRLSVNNKPYPFGFTKA